MRRIGTVALVSIVVAVGLGACSDGDPGSDDPTSSTRATQSATDTPTPTPTPTPTAPVAVVDAASLAEGLRAQIPEITAVTVYDETNDPNNLIGRTGQYTSAAALTDSRSGGGEGIDQGAVVEVFANAADAQARSDYIQATLKSLGPAYGTEWHYVDGASLLRVSGTLPPSVNDQYAAAWAVVTAP